MSSKRKGMPDAHAEHPNVIPLIDIIMCLIVFYMLCARIGIDTGAEEMVIPKSLQGVQIEDLGNTLTLNVFKGVNTADSSPRIVALVPNPETSSSVKQELKIIEPRTNRKQLLETLRYFRFGKDMKPGGGGLNSDNDRFSVIIRGEEDMDYRFLEPVLITCAEAAVANVNFATGTISRVVSASE